jgi:RHS repeat-associated protein
VTEPGSSAWITDGSGNACTERSRSVNQHLQYLPFGESFIDQRTNHDIRFKFTTKEEDSETGYQYFGARYYSSDISIWLSVDPLASKYPNISSYVYVENNPVNYIDEEGENPLAIIGAVVGGATEIVSQTISNGIANKANGDNFFKGWGSKMDWADVGISTVEGAVAGLTAGTSLLITRGVAGAA